MMQWKHVAPGETLPFQFESRGKLRHLNTHDMKIHQIIVRAEGWQETTAVSVDRVGTYFRDQLYKNRSSRKFDSQRLFSRE